MIQGVSNNYNGYQNITPMQNTAYSAPILAMQPQQPSADTVQFKGQQQPEEESFLSKHWGKLLIGGALVAGAFFTHGKLWGKAEEAAKGAKESVGKEAESASHSASETSKDAKENTPPTTTTASEPPTTPPSPIIASPVVAKTREQLGLELTELDKDAERTAYINRGNVSKTFTEAELSKNFDNQWENIQNKVIAKYKAHIEDRIQNCAKNGGTKSSFGMPLYTPAPGFQSSSAPAFIEYAKALADEMGHSMVNIGHSDKTGEILFELNKK